MKIAGPLVIAVQNDENSLKRELHISFKFEFAQQKLNDRVISFQSFIGELTSELQKKDRDDANRQGMETVVQICQNLLEYIRSDEIDLAETIVMEIKPELNLSNFLTDTSSIN